MSGALVRQAVLIVAASRRRRVTRVFPALRARLTRVKRRWASGRARKTRALSGWTTVSRPQSPLRPILSRVAT